MKHHTKTFGDLGVLKAQLDLYEKGFIVSVPLTEHAPFDLVITKDGVSKTVQVKARTVNSRGQLVVSFRSCYSDSNGFHIKAIDKSLVDIYAIYCLDTDKCYYFDPKDFKKSVILRVGMPKNNQRIGINFAIDYCQVP